jgi:hypothetical protein
MSDQKNTLDVVASGTDPDNPKPYARVTVRSDHQTDVGANLDAEAAETHIRAVADAFGWGVTITNPGAVDSSDSGS